MPWIVDWMTAAWLRKTQGTFIDGRFVDMQWDHQPRTSHYYTPPPPGVDVDPHALLPVLQQLCDEHLQDEMNVLVWGVPTVAPIRGWETELAFDAESDRPEPKESDICGIKRKIQDMEVLEDDLRKEREARGEIVEEDDDKNNFNHLGPRPLKRRRTNTWRTNHRYGLRQRSDIGVPSRMPSTLGTSRPSTRR
ncbi:hypothetical protein FRB99_000337 [Tulasnella sp. 403]|nr:hypothetical protein FRB99_000337 [Tulasnella sp. 403]